jgi:zinc protease
MIRFLRYLILGVALASLGLPASAQVRRLPAGVTAVTSVEGIDEYRLANGLQVLLVPDDSKPTTTVNLTYRVGSRHENQGETGMAHLLEHMLFKGTPRHPKVWAEFEKRGLAANGSTWFDRTNYTASFSADADNLRWYLGWLADAMVHSFIARKDLDTEMTVVRNEMESGENSPDRMLFQRTLALMYDWHPYGRETIGARADVENVDIPRLQAFYRLYYQPDNATLIVSGKFDPDQTLAVVAGAFGPLPKPRRVLPKLYTLDPSQDGERSVTLRRVGGTPSLFAAYHVPPGPHPDYAAVELLALLLGDAPAGRLHKRLIETRLAASTFGFSQALADPGFMMLGAQLAPGQDIDAARSAMLATLESAAREPITGEELERARLKWLKNWETAFTDPETIGLSLSESISQGDWRFFFVLRDRVRAIGLADVQRVALERLLPSNRTQGTYVPTDKPERAPAPARVDLAQALASFKPQTAAAKVETFEATPASIDARTQTFSVGGVRVALLRKGTRGGAVQATLTFRFGDAQSLAGQGELASFTAALLDKGTTRLSRTQVQDRLDQLKTELSVANAPGRVTLSLASRREHLPEAIVLVGELLRNPAFPADAFDELRRQALAGIEQARKEPRSVLENAIARQTNVYPRGDPRHARSFDEIVEDIQQASVEGVRAFHARFYSAARVELGAAGDMDVAQVRAALQSAFGDWGGGVPFQRIPQPLVESVPARLLLNTPDKQNANLLVRLPVPLTDASDDYPPLMMANYLLGGGGNSRLWKRIRESDGLSYDVGSGIRWNSEEPNSDWRVSAIFAPQNRAKVEAAFRDELARALKDGFTAQELAEGKKGLLNFRRLSRAQDANLAAALASNLYLNRTFAVSGRTDQAIARLTLDRVNAALRRYLKPDAMVLGFAGDFKP